MCDPITLAIMAAATAASVTGAGIQSREAIDNANRIAKARNARLEQMRTENQKFNDQSREIFNQRVADIDGGVNANLGVAQAETTAGIQGNLPAPETEAPVDGNAPQVVKSDFAKKMADTFRQSTERAKAQGKLQGYSGYFAKQGTDDEAARRGIGVNANFAAGNMGILPHIQDLAEVQAFRSSSGLGEAMQALGQVAGGYAGTRVPAGKPAGGPTNIVPKGFFK
jgi:hypothetical protein